MITTNLTGNLGNHMWQYSVCRIVAEKLGYDWGINSSPTHDYHSGMNQMYFMDVDFGKPIQGIVNKFHEKWINYNYNGDNINITMLDPKIFEIADNTILLGDNGAYGGLFQSERYFENRKSDVINWFRIKQEYEDEYQNKLSSLKIKLDENLCVINFRGGEYRGIPKVLCRTKYWVDCVNYMKELNPKMNFIIITDDPSYAKQVIPFDFNTLHVDIGFDFYVVNNSKWSIISNSSFGWWASYLNIKSNKILAPMYFSCHNFSDGFWGLGESFTEGFTYMSREGIAHEYEKCKIDAYEYYKNKKII